MASAPHFTLDQIRVFVTVVDAGSFGRAAKQLNRAPSAVSYAISNLERLLDLDLFRRSSAQAELTEEGRSLLGSARDLVQRAERLGQEATALRDGADVELRIAVDGLFPIELVARAMQSVRDEYPSCTLSLRSEALGAVPDLLLQRKVDVGISPHLQHHTEFIEASAVSDVEMISVAAPGVEATTHPQIVIRDRTRLTENVSFAIVSGPQYHVADAHTKLELLLLGLGWGLFPREFIADHLADGRLRVLDDSEVPAPVPVTHYVGWRRDTPLGAVGRQFCEVLQSLAATGDAA